MNSVKTQVFSGLIWTYAERFLAQIVSLVVTIILARLVAPEDYGVISIASVFIVIADTFAINGLGNSLIYKKDADKIDFSSVFFFNIVFSTVLYAIFFIIAQPLAVFYEMELLTPVLRVMAIRIPIAAINSVQQAYISKKMEFKKFFYATLGGTIASAVLGVILAILGMGVWALVAQYLSNVIVDTMILWFTVKWRPCLVYSHKRMKELYSYGWKILVTSLMITLYSNVQDLVIGKKFSSEDLAYSNKGKQFPSLVATNINTSITKVLFPAISNCQGNIYQMKNMTRRAVGVGTYVLTPVLIGLAAVADTFVRIILTERWLPCVPYLRVMCIVYALQPIQTSSIQALKGLGKSDVYLKLEIVKKIFGIVVLFITVFCFDNVFAIIVGSLIAEIFSTILNLPCNKKFLNYSYSEQVKDILPTVAMSFCMFTIVGLMETIKINSFLLFVLQIGVGASVYILLSVIFHNQNFKYILDLIVSYIKSK